MARTESRPLPAPVVIPTPRKSPPQVSTLGAVGQLKPRHMLGKMAQKSAPVKLAPPPKQEKLPKRRCKTPSGPIMELMVCLDYKLEL